MLLTTVSASVINLGIQYYLGLASGLPATVYGFGEPFCGDIGRPRPCEHGAPTASGEILIPDNPTVALAAPSRLRLPLGGVRIYARVPPGPCRWIRVTDKMNPRWIGVRGWDLTPGAVYYMTGEWPTANWSGRLHLCPPPRQKLQKQRGQKKLLAADLELQISPTPLDRIPQ